LTKVYARKVVHINDQISIQDVMDEKDAVIRLCHSNPDGNVIRVFDHGWLAYNQYYFFDMERCDFSLDDYIHQSWPDEIAGKVPHFANRDALGPLAKLSQIYTIMIDISNGVAFMHGCGHVHRDLSPKNGRYSVGIQSC
jgi:serine/threonine protein kinase